MKDIAGTVARLGPWRLEKRTADGELYEVIEGDGDAPPRVTFRVEGLAEEQEYARGLPYEAPVVAINSSDAAQPRSVDLT